MRDEAKNLVCDILLRGEHRTRDLIQEYLSRDDTDETLLTVLGALCALSTVFPYARERFVQLIEQHCDLWAKEIIAIQDPVEQLNVLFNMRDATGIPLDFEKLRKIEALARKRLAEQNIPFLL